MTTGIGDMSLVPIHFRGGIGVPFIQKKSQGEVVRIVEEALM